MVISKLVGVLIFECMIALVVASSVFGFFFFRARSRTNAAMRAVSAIVEEQKPQRIPSLKKTLMAQFKLDDAAAESVATDISEKELQLFVRLSELLKIGGEYPSQMFFHAYAGVLENFEKIEMPESNDQETQAPVVDQDMSELIEQNVVLTTEVAKQRDQMRVTLETLETILTEYSVMFNQKSDLDLLKASRDKVLKAMGNFPDNVDVSAPVDPAQAEDVAATVDKLVEENSPENVGAETDKDEDVTESLDIAIEDLDLEVTDDSILDVSDDDIRDLLSEDDDLFKAIAGEV